MLSTAPYSSAISGSHRRRRAACAASGGDKPTKPAFVRSPAQEQLAAFDKAVTDAQKNVGEAMLNALGPLGNALRPRNKPKLASGQVAGWSLVADKLTEARLKSVTPQQAAELVEKGWILLDVSPAEDFAEVRAKGSVSAPLIKLEAGSPLRSLLFASLAVKPTTEDPDGFLGAARDALGGTAAGAIVACSAGGTLRKTQNFPAGQASRSLKAAYLLLTQAGLPAERVLHLQGGLSAWFSAGLDGEGDVGVWEARRGRVPSVGGPMYEQDSPDLM